MPYAGVDLLPFVEISPAQNSAEPSTAQLHELMKNLNTAGRFVGQRFLCFVGSRTMVTASVLGLDYRNVLAVVQSVVRTIN